jgi:hypothetical protein
VRNYLKFVWIEMTAIYHPLPADGLPDYTAVNHAVGRNSHELVTALQIQMDYLHAFDPYPGFTYTNDWTFTRSDIIETWIPLDKTNLYRMMGGTAAAGMYPTYSFIVENLWSQSVTQPAGSQQTQMLFESPRIDGWTDLAGEFRDPSDYASPERGER